MDNLNVDEMTRIYSHLASPESVQKAMQAVEGRGMAVELVATKEAALARLLELIPEGGELMMAASMTLRQIGFEAELESGRHGWRNLRAEIRTETDPAKRQILRRQIATAAAVVGSVHAIAQTGEIVVASQTGSQTAAYMSGNTVLWVAGTQKIVPTLEDAIRRTRKYVAPVLEAGGKGQGRSGMGMIGKLTIFEREVAYLQRNVRLILVSEVLGI